MRVMFGLMLAVCAGIAHGACPAGVSCLWWTGDGNYSTGAAIPAANLVTYTVLNGPKGGPYIALANYNGSPTQAMSVQLQTPAAPKTCFVVTATTLSPDSKGALSVQTSSPSVEVCDKAPPPAPSNGSIVAPTDGSIVNH